MQAGSLARMSKVGLVVSVLAGICVVWLVIVVPPPFPFARMPQEQPVSTMGPRKIIIGVRNDDITAYSDPLHESMVRAAFRHYGVPQTFSIIPNPDNLSEELAEHVFVRSSILDSLLVWHAAGDITFAVHGYTHKRHPQSAGEFDRLPYEEQLDRLRGGKTILERSLQTEIRMFAPPWNQADENTVAACQTLGLTEFSGYRGAPPLPGVAFLNTNAVLFPDTNYEESGHELPSLNVLLPYAHQTTGPCFLLVFYHSRADFATPARFEELDQLLSLLRHDSLVTILPLDEIARSYPAQLTIYNIAGLNLIQSDEARHYAKLFSTPLCWVARTLGRECPMDSLKERALERYFSGNYREVNVLTAEIVRACELHTRLGRLAVALLLGVLVIIFMRSRRRRGAGQPSAAARIAPFACAGVVVTTFGILVALHAFSPSRTEDLTVLIGMTVIAFLISGFAREGGRRPS